MDQRLLSRESAPWYRQNVIAFGAMVLVGLICAELAATAYLYLAEGRFVRLRSASAGAGNQETAD